MALSQKSIIVYGLEVTTLNNSLDFVSTIGGPTKLATLTTGFYSLTTLASEISRAMFAADSSFVYAVSVNRNVSGGLENRFNIATSGSYLKLLFSTGPRVASSISPLIGFNSTDYTGSTVYTGSSSAGTPLVPEFIGYNYLSPDFKQKVFGSVNVSASGLKEAIVFAIQKFVQVEFRYEPKAKVIAQWTPFMSWAIQQRPFEITPEVGLYNTVYNVTMETLEGDGKALGFLMKELIPQFPNMYTTGMMTMRVIPS